ncbi:uncharacterized protein B0I36DRAFT_348410 [Microdochium trichocladiopsis]|uniref:Uncharacterized protein n=1 Tax=Microdochium trichocladiopsis TaxID=1682393 RepID=A0A9P9BPP3_9PEZI|nr:uncharacterized protein B0I36DRAFT_348410 [Microdochium trichocladiopsis]KAH7033339.1 hypothetical protein B0I36DRAFT_348410 [Microdochium trichocladiopsis]
MSHETVGTLLAVIANSLNDALRAMMLADKRAWARDEFEQLRQLEETLDLAKKDFQELPALVNGQLYYENDRTGESLEDLRVLCTRFELHARTFKDWLRMGGPVDPTWAIETKKLRRELHRAQCRAVKRIHATQQQTRGRCLGAQHVYKIQQQQKRQPLDAVDQQQREQQRLEETAACNQTGAFERFGDTDVAFVCDFCDGYIVWEDLREMPATRTYLDDASAYQGPGGGDELEPMSATAIGHLAPASTWPSQTMPFGAGMGLDSLANGTPSRKSTGTATITDVSPRDSTDDSYAAAQRQWQALGYSKITGAEKPIVFAPLAIANHIPPDSRDWQAGLLCPFCDDYYYVEQGDPDADQIKYVQNENGFEDLGALKEHLEWYHAPMVSTGSSSCSVM